MRYAARTAEGHYTGAVYDVLTGAVTHHHEEFGEELVPVSDLLNVGTDSHPLWQAVEATIEERRAAMEVSRFQARAALHTAGILEVVEGVIATSGNAIVQMAWAEAQVFRRNSPTIAALASAASLTPEMVDELFEQAAAISV